MKDEYIDESMLEPIWVCPDCGEEFIWTYRDCDGSGTPTCNQCGCDIEYQGIKICEGFDIKNLHDSITKTLLARALDSIKTLREELNNLKNSAYAKVDWPDSQQYLGLDEVFNAFNDDSSVFVPWGLKPPEDSYDEECEDEDGYLKDFADEYAEEE